MGLTASYVCPGPEVQSKSLHFQEAFLKCYLCFIIGFGLIRLCQRLFQRRQQLLTAIPGILLQLVLVPLLVTALERAKVMPHERRAV